MIKILIVDDEMLERDALRHILHKGMGVTLQIEEAQNGRESLEIYEHFLPDLIFMDIKMPGINGLEAARLMREQSSQVKIVFLTAFHEFEYAHEAIKIGVQDYLIKPSTEDQILTITTKLIQEIETQKVQQFKSRGVEQRLSAMSQLLEQEFLTQLCFHTMAPHTFETYLDLLSIQQNKSSWYGLMSLDLDYDSYPIPVTSDLHKANLTKRCTFLATQRFTPVCDRIFTLHTTDKPIFLLLFNQSQSKAPDQILSLLQPLIADTVQRIRSELHLSITLQVGEMFQELARAKHYLPGFSQPPTLASAVDYHDNLLSQEQALRLSLLRHDRENYEIVIADLNRWILDQSQEFSKTKKTILELATVLNHFYLSRLCCGGERISEIELEQAQIPETLYIALQRFLNHLFEQFDHQSEDSQSKTQLAPLLKHVQTHYNQDISLDQAADLCNLSLFHFTKVFKRVMGTTFVDYLTTLRMDHAIALFESTNMNVSEVSQALGYQDQGYFSKVFKKHTGINPTDYRRKIFLT